MSHSSDPHFLVLHSLRLKGFAAETSIARVSGLGSPEVEVQLAGLHADGFVHHRDGRITGWALTPAGRARHAEYAAADLAGADCQDVVQDAYRRFLEVNDAFLVACTDWQVRLGPGGEQIVNDHKEQSYDRAVRQRLRDIDAAVQPICAELAGVMARFSVYGARFSHALGRLDAGEEEWFTGALIESYHAVWFELHEDLLTTLGIQREKEGAH